MVIASSIPSRERGLLERAGLSWCDERDAVHVSWPGVLVHVECDKRERTPAAERPAGLGAVGIRAVQVLLGEPHDWTTTRLSAEARISIGQAHKALNLLEEHRLDEKPYGGTIG